MNDKVYEKAVKLLERRFHSTGELQAKLKSRGFSDVDIRVVLKRLEELDFLNDERFARIFAENMRLYRDWGYWGVKAKLLQKKIPADLAEKALKEFFSMEDEEIVARRFIGKAKRQGRNDHKKLMQSLSRKGFRSEVIHRVLPPQEVGRD